MITPSSIPLKIGVGGPIGSGKTALLERTLQDLAETGSDGRRSGRLNQ